MANKEVSYGIWRIVRTEDQHTEVYKNDQLCEKAAPALREIAEEIGLEVDPQWRQCQLSSKVVKAIQELGDTPSATKECTQKDQTEQIKRLAKIGIVFCALEDEGSIDTKVIQSIIKKATEYGFNKEHLQTIFDDTLHEVVESPEVDIAEIIEDVANNIANEQEANQIIEICSVMLQTINIQSCIPMINRFGEVGKMLGLDGVESAAIAQKAFQSRSEAEKIARYERIAKLGFVLDFMPGFDHDKYTDDNYFSAMVQHAFDLGLDGQLLWKKHLETVQYFQSERENDDDIINTMLNEVLQNVEDTEEAHQLLEICSELFFFHKADAINDTAGYFLEFGKRINLSEEEVSEIIQTAINTREDINEDTREDTREDSNEDSKEDDESKPLPLIEKIKTDFIVESEEDGVLYDASQTNEWIRDEFIESIQEQNTLEERSALKAMQYTSAEDFAKLLEEDADGMVLAQKIVAAAYYHSQGICIEDVEEDDYVDFDWYTFSDSKGQIYKIYIDIDCG